MRIDVIKEIDKHTRQVWGFNLFDLTAVFVEFTIEEKPPRKRKWVVIKRWDKYENRHENRVEEPILPDEIREEAFREVCNFVKVKTWSEWKK